MNWEKAMRGWERFLINWAYPHRNFLLFKATEKIFQERARGTSIPIDPDAPNKITIVSVGNSHLDSAWRWRKEDAHQKKTLPTFSRAIFHFKKFPGFTFTANATVHYEWIEDVSPQTFQDIRQAVQDGRWEIVGGEYVESDVNIPDGESLVRQRLIGQRYNAKKFAFIADVAWMDDVFGFCAQLPQILAKSGAGYFFTNKFGYSSYSVAKPPDSPKYAGGEKFPFFHFRWVAPDGSNIICTWSIHKNNFYKHLKMYTEHGRTVKPNLENNFNYSMTWQEMRGKLSDEIIPLIVNAYGEGDGGMGPKPFEIMDQMILEQLGFVRNAPIKTFFNLLRPYQDRIPKWQDELYLENHQGTLTSVGMIKENNHTAEVLFHNTESLAVFAGLLGEERCSEELEDDWKRVLFLQFHDVLPGSSICEVYRDAAVDYNLVFHHLASCQESGIMNIANALRKGDKNNYFTIYNGLSWARSGYFEMPKSALNLPTDAPSGVLAVQNIAFSKSVRNRPIQFGMIDVPGTDYLRTTDGKPQLTEWINQPSDKLLIYLPATSQVGAFGVHNLWFLEGNPKIPATGLIIKENPETFILQNNLIEILISKKSGRIISATRNLPTKSKSDGSETLINPLGGQGIGFAMFQDRPHKFDAWNLDDNYRSKPVLFPDVETIIIEEKGPLRSTVLIKYLPTADKSTFYCRISLYHNDPKIYGELLVDWQEDHKLLKLALETRFEGLNVHCGSPFGITKRSARPRTVYQEAMFEYPFQQFAFLESESPLGNLSGIAMYSQSKFGMCALGGRMEMSLLKSPGFASPDMRHATLDTDAPQSPIVDRGFHHIPFALELISREISVMEIVRTGFEYNNPLVALETDYDHENQTFISCETQNVIVTAVKEIEPFMQDAPDWFYQPNMGEMAFIVRCVEYLGQSSPITIKFHPKFDVRKVQEVDLLERVKQNGIELGDATYENHQVHVTIHPFEVKSIMIFAKIPLEDTNKTN